MVCRYGDPRITHVPHGVLPEKHTLGDRQSGRIMRTKNLVVSPPSVLEAPFTPNEACLGD